MNRKLLASSLVVCALVLAGFSLKGRSAKPTDTWTNDIGAALARIDAEFDGDLGVYVKRLSDGREVRYQSAEPWYLASTIKVFVAAAVMNEVDRGRVRLDEKLRLRKSDFVDGSGEVNWKKPGEIVTIGYLLEQMLTQSDSTATDMLIRRIGVAELNRFVQSTAPGTGYITTILEVRHAAYSEAHPRARRLTNLDFIAFKAAPPARRLHAFARKIRVSPKALRVRSIEDAFERYYARGSNSGSLETFGLFIERLLAGELVSRESTAHITRLMEAATTGKNRIQAGLPASYRFAQKTGTQIDRLCNVGRITRPDGEQLIVTACVRDFADFKRGELAFNRVGAALANLSRI